jgi:hypothetical protein
MKKVVKPKLASKVYLYECTFTWQTLTCTGETSVYGTPAYGQCCYWTCGNSHGYIPNQSCY